MTALHITRTLARTDITLRHGNVHHALAAGLACLLLLCAAACTAMAQNVEEHDAKAAFMLKVLNFVQWPGDSHRDLVIGVVGSDSTMDALQRQAYGKPVNGRNVVVRRMAVESDLRACQIVFIGAGERKNISPILERLRGSNVLTVSEVEGFGQHGGAINLLLSGGRIRMEVNPHAAERAHLQISSRLLSLATIVNDGN
ncbi:MAG: YfiR family protein [Acidobacteriota bacterium]|nr:YfiR family protein [Acidobacteriota bacterium]